MGWVVPEAPEVLTGKRVRSSARVRPGSRPPSNSPGSGHEVHVFEREPKAGGLLRYGIPDFKMEKHHIDRRIRQMEAEGVVFHYGVEVGAGKPFDALHNEFDAVLVANGAEAPRDPQLPGQELPASITPCPIWCSRTGASARNR
jgi:glutamate synthase (NADPH/NADH) small chain